MKAFLNIRELLTSQFFKVSGLNGLFTLLKVFSILLATKIIAVITGVSGVAMVGQLQNVIAIVSLLASGGFNQGLTKYIAEFKNDPQAVEEFISTAFQLALAATGIISLILFFFSLPLAEILFSDPGYETIMIVFSLSVLFYTMNNFLITIVNGYQQYSLYFKINVTTTIVVFILTILLVIMFHEFGALLAMIIPQSIVCLLTYYYIRNEQWKPFIGFSLFRSDRMRSLLRYTMIVMLSTIAWPTVKIFIRTYVINSISTVDAGIWQATSNINENIVNMAVASFSVYLIPKLSSIDDIHLLRKELINVYKIIIPATIIGFLIVYVFRDFFILLLYSKDFSSVRDYLALQMVGSFFWMCKIPIMYFMLAKGHTNTYFAYEIVFAIFYTVLAVLLLPQYGIQGIQISFAIYNFVYLLLNIRFIRIQLRISAVQ